MIPSAPWWLGGLIANAAIMRIEYLCRGGGFADFGAALWTTWPYILVAQYGIFCMYNGPSFLLAWACFTAVNCALRIVNTYLLGEPPSVAAWAALGFMVLAIVVMRLWGTTGGTAT